MNDILAAYLKAYTSKRAADSVADDIAVGTGSGLLGGLMGYVGGAYRGEDLRLSKAHKIKGALHRIGMKLHDIEFKSSLLRPHLSHLIKRLDEVKKDHPNLIPSYESSVKEYRDKLDKLKQLANKQNDRYYKTWSKATKLQKAIKNSRRVGGVAGAVGAGLLSTLLYNKLQKD